MEVAFIIVPLGESDRERCFAGWQPPNHAPIKRALGVLIFRERGRALSWHGSLYRQRLRSGVPVTKTWALTECITSLAR